MTPTRVLLFLLGSGLFSVAYCQAPLFYSNQNQYFLHGLADAGWGQLRDDWLANTEDPTPAFSGLVALTARHLHPWAFHLYHALFLGAYGASMFGLFRFLGPEKAARRWPIFLALFVAAHSALARWLSYRWVGFDYPWFLQAGVAGQYLLGAMLQPSVFGVLLVVAVCLFARGRPYLAAVCTGLAADFHFTYLLPGGLLTLGFLAALVLERRYRTALGVGSLALALVLPAIAYVVFRLGPTSPEEFRQAQDILVNVRIPHHSRPDLWLDPLAGVQIAWIVLALVLVRGTRLFRVLAVPFALSALLTVVQVATGNDTLALLFPWRISAVLVPISTTVILSRVILAPSLPVGGRIAWAASGLGLAVIVVAGLWISVNRLAFQLDEDELKLMRHVRDHSSPGEVYLLPVRVLVATTRGSLSSDFKPLGEKKRSGQVIPVNLQRFRLHARAPIYVDFKSIPYKDTDVIEWHRRLLLAQSLQERIDAGGSVDELRGLGITHVVRLAGSSPVKGLEKVYEDDSYRVYRLTPPR